MRTGKRYSVSCILFVLAVFGGFSLAAQNLPIGGWNTHLPYNTCRYVTGSSTYVWCATDNGLFRLTKADYSIERITKIEGLSDLLIGAIGYNENNGTLLVGYQNGNIDIIRGSTIINLPDIKRAQIVGDKAIHRFFFVGSLAYVSTGFGIVVIDTDRDEVRDTYLIGNNANYVEVYDLTSDGTTIFAATENGIYFAPINDPYLSNFATWNRFTSVIPQGLTSDYANGNFTSLAYFNNKLITQYEAAIPANATGRMIYYDFSNSTWDTIPDIDFGLGIHFTDFKVVNGFLYVANTFSVRRLDAALSNVFYYNALDWVPGDYLTPQQVYVDAGGNVWEADSRKGLVRAVDFAEGYAYSPNGPISIDSYAMDLKNDELIFVTGGHDDAWNNVINREGHSVYSNHTWTNFKGVQMPALDTISDFISCAIDPNNNAHYFMGSWCQGLVEVNNGAITHVWDDNNSTLRSKLEYHWVGVGGMAYDADGNLWMTNSHVVTCLNVLKADGTWRSFDFSSQIPVGETVSELMITSTGQKWMILPRGQGMLVFDDNGTIDNTSDDHKIRLGFNAGAGGIPGTEVYSMAEDKDGEVWVGTDAGVGVFYCAQNIFSSGGCDAQQVLLEQDGHVQILLETQVVTCIAVDGANRKWIGTEGGGVFLMSADGTKQIAHFDASNSPLLSDDITSMAINQKTGEVFFGTSKGIVSYRSEATEGGEHIGDVYAFPNPVGPDYTGPIAITGLVKDADVKITDVRGNVVFKTVSLGGQAIWDGNNFSGERAATGVYLVFITNEDGTEKAVTKILLVN